MLDSIRSTSMKRLLWIYVAILWISSVGEWAFALFCEYVLHLGYPYNTPLLFYGDRFTDWTNFLARTAHFGQPGMLTRLDFGLPFPYPVPSMLPFVLIQKLSSYPLATFLTITVLLFVAGAALLSWYLQRRFHPPTVVHIAVWSTVLIGYPGVFLFDRGNIEVFLWALVAGGLAAFTCRRPYLAATCFAIAGSMKIYPAIFLLLFVPRRQYRAMVYGGVLIAAVTLGMLAIIGPSIPQAFRDLGPSATTLRDYQIMVMARNVLRFDHSLFSLWKVLSAAYVTRFLGYSPDDASALHFYTAGRVYSILAPLVFLAAYALRIRKLPLLNQAGTLLLFSVLLPYVSYDYTLVHLYTLFALLLIAWLEGTGSDRQIVTISRIVLILAVVFTPLAALARHLYGGQIKAVLMLACLYLLLTVPFPTELFGDGFAADRNTNHTPAEA